VGARIETLRKWTSRFGHMKIVLIDDDPDDLDLISDLLDESGFNSVKIIRVDNALDGLTEIQKQDATVYLLDYRLGAVSGLDILRQLNPLKIERPIILLTGMDDRETDLAAMDAGAWDFLSKERLTAETLERSIRYCVRRADDLEKLRLAEKAKVERDAAEAASRAKSEFLAHMSHEIRSPLTGILGFAKLASDTQVSDKERFEFIDIIKKSGDHLLRVVNDILDLSKVEQGRLEVESREFDWMKAVEDIAQIFRATAASKGLSLHVELPSQLTRFMSGDEHRFRQVLMNLLNNAIKFTGAGFVKIKANHESDSNSLVFDVVDSGIGMSESEQARIFQPFTQANPSLSRRFGGSGLGLHLSKSIAEAMGGELGLHQSGPNQGSTFRFVLPNVLVQSQTAATQEDIDTIRFEDDKKMRVLLVEDSSDNRMLVKHFLKSENVELSFASNGRDGAEAALASDYDVVLMDIQMPVMDGYEATQFLRSQGYDRPIIALTAHAFNEERDRALAAGFSDFVSKPIQPAQLIAKLKSAAGTALAPALSDKRFSNSYADKTFPTFTQEIL